MPTGAGSGELAERVFIPQSASWWDTIRDGGFEYSLCSSLD